METMKSIVVAYGKNLEIEQSGDLPWKRSLPADLANFRKLTRNGSLIMGWKTFESIGSKPLPDRENIVISLEPTGVKGVLTAVNLSSALTLARYPVFIIGGGRIYHDSLDLVDQIFATEIDATFPKADTFFPKLDPETWQEVSRTHHPADDKNKYAFDFVKYQRRTQKGDPNS